MSFNRIVEDGVIIQTITGSVLYGTNDENSDIDYFSVFIPTKRQVLGLVDFEQSSKIYEQENKIIDVQYHSLIKFIKLAIGNNPNILSLFYTPDSRMVKLNKYGEILLSSRDLFLSKKCFKTFKGYAQSQKSKMTTHVRVGKRKELCEKLGFDTKYAMHLIRLYYECIDILKYKKIIYPSENVQTLMAIKNGEKDLEWVLAESAKLERKIDELYLSSTLQEMPKIQEIENLQISMIDRFWKESEK